VQHLHGSITLDRMSKAANSVGTSSVEAVMKAIGYTEFGGPEVLRGLQMPEPHTPATLPGGSYPEPPYVLTW
jgi:hypothetical protein